MSDINQSGIVPLNYRVLIEPLEVEEVTGGGIIIPESVQDSKVKAQYKGRLIALGKNAFDRCSTSPKLGDVVYFIQYEGHLEKGKDGKEYRLCNDDLVSAVQGKNGEIVPLWFNVLIKMKTLEKKTQGGIILRDHYRSREDIKQTTGEIIALSNDAFDNFGDHPKVGERVIIIKYGGSHIREDDKLYRILKDEEICAITNQS